MKGIYLMTRYLRLNIFTLAIASLLIIHLAGNAMALPPTATPEEQNTPVKSSAIVADVLKVIDGDTLLVRAEIWPNQHIQSYVRIDGIDTPEIKGKCAEEREMARQASLHLEHTLPKDKKVILRNIRNGKFAGRVIADIYTDHGESIAQEMLRANLARSYHGKKRQPWCDTNKL